jgi:SAM-dependent methyltransferase
MLCEWNMTDAMTPHGLALRSYLAGDHDAKLSVTRSDGVVTALPIAPFFRTPAEFSALERQALDLCRGRVLDVGAGTGCHSLVLHARGLEVVSIDISAEAVDVMRQRGVPRARVADVFDFEESGFDTLLMMMHGIGMVETLAGLERFLAHARTLLNPGGRILVDSMDVRATSDPACLAYQESLRNEGHCVGEVRLRFSFRGVDGPECGWLHIDYVTLADYSGRAASSPRKVTDREGSGDYLAELTRNG